MIPRLYLLNKIKHKGYRFDDQTPRIEIYKKAGSTDRIEIHKTDKVSEEYAVMVLKKAGCPREEVQRFLRDAKA